MSDNTTEWCTSLADLRTHGSSVNCPYTVLDLNPGLLPGLGDAKVVEVADLLKQNNTIKRVDLGWNNIGDTGATALAEAFRVNSTITYVELGCNSIFNRITREIDDRIEQQLQINREISRDLEEISRSFLTFEYLLYHLNSWPCATSKIQHQPTLSTSILSSTSKEEPKPELEVEPECKRKEQNERGTVEEEEEEEEEEEGEEGEEEEDETRITQENRSKEKKRLPVLPLECVNLISEFLTWEDLSKKRAIPILRTNPSLFSSRSLTDSDKMTDFEYFSEKYDGDENNKHKLQLKLKLKLKQSYVSRTDFDN